jgi:beta-lactamase class A
MAVARLSGRLRDVARGVRGRVSLCVRDVATDEELAVDADARMRLASLVTVPIALALWDHAARGAIDLREAVRVDVPLAHDDSGVLARMAPGEATLSLRALGAIMLVVSDNTATNLILDRIGMDAVNARMDALGLRDVRVRRKMLDFAAAARGEENTGTARQLAALMVTLREGHALDPEGTRAVLGLLENNQLSFFRRRAPRGARIADKGGELNKFRACMGLVSRGRAPIAIAALADELEDEREGDAFLAEVARILLEE